MMYGAQRLLPGGCGVRNFYDFDHRSYYYNERFSHFELGGADLGIACFVNTLKCRRAYDELKDKFKIVYQSSPRLNSNSGRQFFMVVYDKKD